MEDRTELLAAIDASQMTADDKALLRDVIRVTDGGGWGITVVIAFGVYMEALRKMAA
jgi:hypothetical protein